MINIYDKGQEFIVPKDNEKSDNIGFYIILKKKLDKYAKIKSKEQSE
jgi:hypothetical protein